MAETQRHLEAFNYYYGLYPRRAYKEVAKKFGVSDAAVGKWAKKYHWEQRIIERIADEEKQWSINLAKSKILADEQHIKIAKLLQSKGLAALDKDDPLNAMTPKEGADVLDKAVKLERDILGATGTDQDGKQQGPAPINASQNIIAVVINEVLNGDRQTVIQALKDDLKQLRAGPGRKDKTGK